MADESADEPLGGGSRGVSMSSSAAAGRYVLCRPLGGLNDMLCQIADCRAYAARYGRVVVVDTNHSETEYFRDRFSAYFTSSRPDLVLDIEAAPALVALRPCVPAFIEGRVGDYRIRHHRARNLPVDRLTGQVVTFDFTRDHPAPLLVHHLWGGGRNGLAALEGLSITDEIQGRLCERLSAVGGPYCAVHIRATDYRTRYEADLVRIAPYLTGPVFVATDSARALQAAKDILGRERVLSFSALPAGGEEPLHRLRDDQDTFSRNADAILDLLMLALARRLFAFKIVEKPENAPDYSGFSRLSAALHRSGGLASRLLGARGALAGQLERLQITPGAPARRPLVRPLGVLCS